MISEEIAFLQLVKLTFVFGVDFRLGCLKLARLQQRWCNAWGFLCQRAVFLS